MKLFKVILNFCLISLAFSYPFNETIDSGESEQELTRFLHNQQLFEEYGLEIEPRIVQDGYLTTPQLLKKYGYPVEIHPVQTQDGYILEMHRIPKAGGTPVYLQHGIMDSSAGWVIMGPQSAFAYYLHDLGYDVWMGNARGNRYSKKHTYLDIRSKEFWNFSFHELGKFDLPAMIDYIIKKTSVPKIHYVGHSQGTTSFWVMCSLLPTYCDKIISMQAMAPIAFMKYIKSPLIKVLAPFVNQFNWISKFIGAYEFLPNNELLKMGGQILCKKEAFTQVICSNAIFLVTGYNSQELNKTMLPAVLGHVPAGSSTKQFIHYGQLVKSGEFRMFDYGWLKNYKVYGKLTPTSYDLSNVRAPVYLHYSMNDWLADPTDVSKLEKKLPNVVKPYVVPQPKFNHLDFLIGIHSRDLVQEQVAKSMKEEENKTH